jgi:hypothetical protein
MQRHDVVALDVATAPLAVSLLEVEAADFAGHRPPGIADLRQLALPSARLRSYATCRRISSRPSAAPSSSSGTGEVRAANSPRASAALIDAAMPCIRPGSAVNSAMTLFVGTPLLVARPGWPGRFVARSAVLRATLLTFRKSGRRSWTGCCGSLRNRADSSMTRGSVAAICRQLFRATRSPAKISSSRSQSSLRGTASSMARTIGPTSTVRSARVKNRRAAARSRAASPPTHNRKSQRGCVPTAQHSCRSQVKIRLRLYSGEEAALLLDGTPPGGMCISGRDRRGAMTGLA